jgi:hypothetical protein
MPAPPKCDLDPQQQPIKALIFDLMGTCLDWHSAVSPVLLKAFSIPEGEKPAFTAVKWRHECLDGYYDSSETGFPQEDVDYTRRRVLLDMVQSHRVEMDGVEVEACVKAWHEQIGMVFVFFFQIFSALTLRLVAEYGVTSMAGRGCSAAFVEI